MKRSEMIDILQLFFETDCAYESPADARLSANRILALIESSGMLPPEIPDPTDSLHPESSFVNEWEPGSDDDKKDYCGAV